MMYARISSKVCMITKQAVHRTNLLDPRGRRAQILFGVVCMDEAPKPSHLATEPQRTNAYAHVTQPCTLEQTVGEGTVAASLP